MSESRDADRGERTLRKGTRVEVRTGFDGTWVSGYVIESTHPDGYRIRRRSDDEVLPVVFKADAVRREHKNSMWWV
jgi:hypothetical protein